MVHYHGHGFCGLIYGAKCEREFHESLHVHNSESIDTRNNIYECFSTPANVSIILPTVLPLLCLNGTDHRHKKSFGVRHRPLLHIQWICKIRFESIWTCGRNHLSAIVQVGDVSLCIKRDVGWSMASTVDDSHNTDADGGDSSPASHLFVLHG